MPPRHRPQDLTTRDAMTDTNSKPSMPTTNQPLNAEKRGTVGPLLLTILLVAGIVGLFALTLWAVTLD
jgi:hypothetical protein